MKNKKGQAGLGIYLSVITTIFMIGLIVFVFIIAGNKLHTATTDTSDAIAVTNITSASVITNANNNSGGTAVALTGLDSTLPSCALTISTIYNATGTLLTTAEYKTSGCKIYSVPVLTQNGVKINVTGTYRYTTETSASQVINESTNAFTEVTDWFGTFIVLGAMVVLILLIVIVIGSIRNTGLINREGA